MARPLEELRKIRIKKLEEIKKLGIDPFPARCERSHSVAQGRKMMGKKVAVAGRIMAMRGHGGIWFFDLRDESGQIQLVFKSENTKGKSVKLLPLLDIGDFIDVQGKVFKTKAGEISIEVKGFHLLAKSLRSLPEKRKGLKDPELIFRRRYLDLAINPQRRELFKRKAKFWEANREFLKKEGFIEVETPVLEHVTGGADAKPFVTHMDTLNQDFYLRISTELYLKRLIGGGFEKVFTLAPNFRNEGISDEHLPEYYQIEWYWAYADYRDNIEMIKAMFLYFAKKVYGKTKFKNRGYEFNLADEWEEIDYIKVIKEKHGIDIFKSSGKEMEAVIDKHGIQLEGAVNRMRLVDNLWKIIRKEISGPAVLIRQRTVKKD